MKKCNICGNVVTDEALFCIKCGSKLKEDQNCPFCGNTVPEGSILCTSCGKSIESPENIPNSDVIIESVDEVKRGLENANREDELSEKNTQEHYEKNVNALSSCKLGNDLHDDGGSDITPTTQNNPSKKKFKVWEILIKVAFWIAVALFIVFSVIPNYKLDKAIEYAEDWVAQSDEITGYYYLGLNVNGDYVFELYGDDSYRLVYYSSDKKKGNVIPASNSDVSDQNTIADPDTSKQNVSELISSTLNKISYDWMVTKSDEISYIFEGIDCISSGDRKYRPYYVYKVYNEQMPDNYRFVAVCPYNDDYFDGPVIYPCVLSATDHHSTWTYVVFDESMRPSDEESNLEEELEAILNEWKASDTWPGKNNSYSSGGTEQLEDDDYGYLYTVEDSIPYVREYIANYGPSNGSYEYEPEGETMFEGLDYGWCYYIYIDTPDMALTWSWIYITEYGDLYEYKTINDSTEYLYNVFYR